MDVNGYFSSDGSYYVARTSYRLTDSRIECEPYFYDPDTVEKVDTTKDGDYTTCGVGRAPSAASVAPARAVWLTLTAVRPSRGGYLAAYPGGAARPTTSDVNAVSEVTTANSGPVKVGASGDVNVYSTAAFQETGSTVLIDISGYFADPPQQPSQQGIWAWGLTANPDPFLNTPVSGVRSVAGSDTLTTALLGDGTVAAWVPPKLLLNHLERRVTLATVLGIHNVTQLAGRGTTYALHDDGTVTAWGGNAYGEFGDGTQNDQTVVTWDNNTVSVHGHEVGVSDVTAVGAATNIGYAIKSDGTVWAWGRNNTGQLGDGTTTGSYVPVQVSNLSNVKSISGGPYLSYAVDAGGQLWRWGYLGATIVPTPQPVAGACSSGVSVLANGYGAWELCDDGTVWQLDQRGTVNVPGRPFPQRLTTLDHVTALGGALPRDLSNPRWDEGVQALRDDGTVWRDNPSDDQFHPIYGLTGATGVGAAGLVAYVLVQ